jgi:hypothetical protein
MTFKRYVATVLGIFAGTTVILIAPPDLAGIMMLGLLIWGLVTLWKKAASGPKAPQMIQRTVTAPDGRVSLSSSRLTSRHRLPSPGCIPLGRHQSWPKVSPIS